MDYRYPTVDRWYLSRGIFIETDPFNETDVTVLENDATVNAKLICDVCKGLFWESFARVMPQTENLVADIEFFGLEEVVRYRKVFLEVDEKHSKWMLELHCKVEKKLNEMANELQTVLTDNMKKIIANMISE